MNLAVDPFPRAIVRKNTLSSEEEKCWRIVRQTMQYILNSYSAQNFWGACFHLSASIVEFVLG